MDYKKLSKITDTKEYWDVRGTDSRDWAKQWLEDERNPKLSEDEVIEKLSDLAEESDLETCSALAYAIMKLSGK